MKKLITLLLIAAIACTFVDDLKEAGLFDERDDVVLNGLPDFFSRLWEKIKKIWNDIPGAFQNVVNFLKEKEYWDSLIDIIQKYGTKYGTEFCAKYLDAELCGDVVGWIFSLLDSL